jgi:5'-nucleotidase
MIIYVDMDDTLCAYTSEHRQFRLSHPEITFPQSIPGFFKDLDPIVGAVEALHWLNTQQGARIFILTAPSVHNPLCYTEKRLWVEKHLGFDWVHQLIISPHKGLFIGDYLIDDCSFGRGQEGFTGKLLHFGKYPLIYWSNVCDYFIENHGFR